MRLLQYFFKTSGIPVLRPQMSALRGESDTSDRKASEASAGAQGEAQASIGRLGVLRTRGIRIAPNGKTTAEYIAEWPGKSYGVRKPHVGETPLSNSEWPYLFKGEIE